MNIHHPNGISRLRSFAADFQMFLMRCMVTLNPGVAFLLNWHIAAIAHHLDRVRRGEITRLIINMPPRYLKSLMVSVAFPLLSWAWTWHRIITISYGAELAAKHQRRLPCNCGESPGTGGLSENDDSRNVEMS